MRPDVIFHAAAYKHVPLVEANPILGIRNNVSGFLNLLEVAVDAGVGRLVMTSTDKAERPTNVMGASKRICELFNAILPVTPACATCASAMSWARRAAWYRASWNRSPRAGR